MVSLPFRPVSTHPQKSTEELTGS
ncbi:rCG43061 [Rattus norvegicus]|uniref:RCG43061 n=1 Tax=Rattus norvegicus TaxID=10116 RepID=A6IVN5_RAT|nr:rCG43061 [Rattus norvegicus]